MNISLGTDIVHIPRIQAALDRFSDRFLQRIYTPTEQQDYWALCSAVHGSRNAIVYLAGRWAAKEAVVKALGMGWRGIRYTDVEIQRQPNGAPQVYLHSSKTGNASAPPSGQWQLSLSHDGNYAIATALFFVPAPPVSARRGSIESESIR